IDEKVDPITAFDYHLHQQQITAELRGHAFRAVENTDPRTIELIRRLCDPRWFVLSSSNNELFWAYPPDTNPTAVKRIEDALAKHAIEVRAVRDEDVPTILAGIDTTPREFSGRIISAENAGMTPMMLDG